MSGIGYEKLKYEAVIHAQLQASVMNAPHVQKKDKKSWTVEDFLPDFAKEKKRPKTPEEIEKEWMRFAV